MAKVCEICGTEGLEGSKYGWCYSCNMEVTYIPENLYIEESEEAEEDDNQ